jgi:hypothetical protein
MRIMPSAVGKAKRGSSLSAMRDRLRDTIVTLRKRNLSIYDISRTLAAEGTPRSPVAVSQVLQAEGFARLPRRADEDRPVHPQQTAAAVADVRALNLAPRQFRTQFGGLFLFVPFLSPLKSTMVSIWLAYTIVWLAYGMRLISGTLLQVAPELEEAARTTGATETRVKLDVTLPLIRTGMLASWLLIFLIFVREYSTGIYLLGPGTEVIGSLLVSLWGTGAIDLVSALSVVNVVMIGVGLLLAIRLGVRLHG